MGSGSVRGRVRVRGSGLWNRLAQAPRTPALFRIRGLLLHLALFLHLARALDPAMILILILFPILFLFL
jgi:hypothetical protein